MCSVRYNHDNRILEEVKILKICIYLDIDVEESGYTDEDELKDNLLDFTRDLIINGAENEGVGCTLILVGY